MLAFWMSRFSKEVLGGILIVRRSTHGWFVVAVGGFIILMNLSFNKVHFHHRRFLGYKTHTIHLWYIYLHEWLIFRVDVGVYIYIYAIHGCYGKITNLKRAKCSTGLPNKQNI